MSFRVFHKTEDSLGLGLSFASIGIPNSHPRVCCGNRDGDGVTMETRNCAISGFP